jgi:hypothetical protein
MDSAGRAGRWSEVLNLLVRKDVRVRTPPRAQEKARSEPDCDAGDAGVDRLRGRAAARPLAQSMPVVRLRIASTRLGAPSSNHISIQKAALTEL